VLQFAGYGRPSRAKKTREEGRSACSRGRDPRNLVLMVSHTPRHRRDGGTVLQGLRQGSLSDATFAGISRTVVTAFAMAEGQGVEARASLAGFGRIRREAIKVVRARLPARFRGFPRRAGRMRQPRDGLVAVDGPGQAKLETPRRRALTGLADLRVLLTASS